jgi:hypothetical protein
MIKHSVGALHGGDNPGLARRDFLKVGAGFSLALTLAGTLPGCGDVGNKAPAQGYTFLQAGDVELFSAIAPAVVLDLLTVDGAERDKRIRETVRNIDTTIAGLDMHSRGELRKLLDLLAIAPLRYVLTGDGGWKDASPETLNAFLERWRGSRFATLNAGSNVLVKLTAASHYALPASFASAGYPGPPEHVFNAINT